MLSIELPSEVINKSGWFSFLESYPYWKHIINCFLKIGKTCRQRTQWIIFELFQEMLVSLNFGWEENKIMKDEFQRSTLDDL